MTTEDPNLVRLMRERGIRPPTIEHFGIVVDRSAGGWSYPAGDRLRIKSWSALGAKYRWDRSIDGGVPLGGLYGLDDIVLGMDGRIYLVNGEPAKWVAWQIGVPAFCTFGEGMALPSDTVQRLKELGVREVVIIPDRDEPGRRSADRRAEELSRHFTVRVIELPAEVGEKGDLVDLYRECGFDDELTRLALRVLTASARVVEPTAATTTNFISVHTPSGRTEINIAPLTAAAILAMDLPDVPWLVDKLIPAKGICMLAGAPGVGKSWLGLSLGLAVARGEQDWLGFRVRSGPVLYLDEENVLQLVYQRLRLLGGEAAEELHIAIGSGLRLDRPDHRGALLELIARLQPVLIVFDSARWFHGSDENDATQMAALSRALIEIRNISGGALLVLDHTRKGTDGDPMSWARGSGEKAAFVDSMLTARRVAKNQMEIRHTKSRWDEPVEAFEVMIGGKPPRVELTVVGTARDAEHDRTADALTLIVRRVMDEGPMGRKELINAVVRDAREDDLKPGRRRVGQVIDALVEEGVHLAVEAVREGNRGRPRNQYYRPPVPDDGLPDLVTGGSEGTEDVAAPELTEAPDAVVGVSPSLTADVREQLVHVATPGRKFSHRSLLEAIRARASRLDPPVVVDARALVEELVADGSLHVRRGRLRRGGAVQDIYRAPVRRSGHRAEGAS